MVIRSATFVTSSQKVSQCPSPTLPEYAFIGRSNVGKSSLINMLVRQHGLAKTSGNPGKTQTINHFLVNESWYIVDLPGYGYARVSKKMREQWDRLISAYVTGRENLVSLFVLIDIRHEPIASDLAFMERLALASVPFARVFTKSDKVSLSERERIVNLHNRTMLERWETLPPSFISSAEKGTGRDEILDYLEENMKFFTYEK